MGSELDDIDREILFLLQHDARNMTAVDMAAKLDVSPSTVRNRIERLEEENVLTGYRPQINYQRIDVPLLATLVATATPTVRNEAVEELLEVDGVLEVHELLGGRENVHLTVLAKDNCHLSEITDEIHELNVEIDRMEITKQKRVQSPEAFKKALDLAYRDEQ